MKREIISTDKAVQSKNPLSQAIRTENQIYLSGQLGKDPTTGQLVEGMEAQTRMCLENTKAILEAAGASLGNVVKATIFVTDLDQMSPMNQVYKSYFPNDPPTRSCVEVRRLAGDALIESEVVANIS
jgi:2-iminobutanoate/2-iminopropanoate deaminase